MSTRLSPDTIAAINKYGPSVRGVAKRYGLSGAALLGKLVEGESGDRMSAVSSAKARGKGQFIPSTRAAVIKKYGIDPWSSTDAAVHAAALHLRGKITGRTGLAGYNPGDPSYTSYILGQKIGDVHAGSAHAVAASHTHTTVTNPVLHPGGEHVDTHQAVLDALLSPHAHGSLSKNIVSRIESGQYTTYTKPSVTPGKVSVHTTSSGPAQGHGSHPVGHLNFVNDQSGVQADVHAYLHDMTRFLGHGLDVGTGKVGHSTYVAGTTRRSDHADGNADDIPATGSKGDHIAEAAFRAAGVSLATARKWAKQGGLHNLVHNGKRIQIIWKTNIGGNHYNHVHVGVKPA